jgi:hypothetical protein
MGVDEAGNLQSVQVNGLNTNHIQVQKAYQLFQHKL